ncbi:unnamed protein product, partial [Larinioides sclopetarius]
MSKRISPPRDGGEGPSWKRPVQDPPTTAILRARKRIIGSRGRERPSRPE